MNKSLNFSQNLYDFPVVEEFVPCWKNFNGKANVCSFKAVKFN